LVAVHSVDLAGVRVVVLEVLVEVDLEEGELVEVGKIYYTM
jgi:hypothetical protein